MRWILAITVFLATLFLSPGHIIIDRGITFGEAWEQRAGDQCRVVVPLFRNAQCWNNRLRVDRLRE